MKVIVSRHAEFNRHGIELEIGEDDLRSEVEDWDTLSADDKAKRLMRFGMKQIIFHNVAESIITMDEAKRQLTKWGFVGAAKPTRDIPVEDKATA